MSGNYPDGCTQLTHDRYYGQPEPDEARLDCGHWGELACAWQEAGPWFLCRDCGEKAEAIAKAFDQIELDATIDALLQYGAARMGNHTLFHGLMHKLEAARAYQREVNRG